MRLLLDDRFAPITSEIGFLETDISDVVTFITEWIESLEKELERKVSIVNRPVSGNLPDVLAALLPLTSYERRRSLLVPTRSKWVAYFDNGYRGTDAISVAAYPPTQLKCRGVLACAIPHTYDKKTGRGRLGGLKFHVYGPEENELLESIRSIEIIRDVDRTDYHSSGTPFPFEDVQHYKARRITDRFTTEMLDDYLRALGIHAFEEDFYQPEKAILIEKIGEANPNLREYTLEEARAHF